MLKSKGSRRGDVFLPTDDLPECLGFFSKDDDKATGILEKASVMPGDSDRFRLDWPSTVPFSSVDDVNDPALRAILCKLYGDSNDSNEGSGQDTKQKAVPDIGTSSCTVLEDALGSKSGFEQKENHAKVKEDTIYDTLTGNDEIRLLHLDPYDKEDEILHGELRPARLSDRPIYTALSYTWADSSGDRSLCEYIFLGQAWMHFAITSNCAAALRRLRYKGMKRIIWVDSICIDQESIEEKNHQVSLMREIYQSAQSVDIFLGQDGGTVTPAARLMHHLSEKRLRAGEAVLNAWDDVYDAQGAIDLFQQPYWSRIWVIQEALLSASATLIFGNVSLSFQEFVRNYARRLNTDRALGFNYYESEFGVQLPRWILFDDLSRLGDPATFLNLLRDTSTCKASDPRDKVFALLGLVPEARSEGLVADYSKTTSEIFTGIAAYFLLRHGQSSILDAAAATPATFKSEDAEARASNIHRPSWIPFQTVLPSEKYDRRGSNLWVPFFEWSRREEKRGRKPTIRHELEPASLSTNLESRGRFKVLDRCGILLVKALPVVHLSTVELGLRVLHKAFVLTKTHKLEADGKLRGVQARKTRIPWTFHVFSNSTITFEDDWIIDVPGCKTFLHIRPSQRAPGTYELVSPSAIVWTMMCPTMPYGLREYLNASRSWSPSHWADYRMWMPLTSFELQHLRFLRSWESMNASESSTVPSSSFEDELSTSDLDEYAQWIASVQPDSADEFYGLYPGNERLSVKKVSIYLERWQDLKLWSRIHKVILDIPWKQYLTDLAEIKAIVWSRLTSENPTEHVFDDLELRLASLFLSLHENLAGISFKPATGEHLSRDFSSPEISWELMMAIRALPSSCSINYVRERESMVFLEWERVKEFWEFMQQSKHVCVAVRVKFVQLDVLKGLRSREQREFLIS